MKLFVCGDSYMSPSTSAPGTHFSEIVANELNYELVIYSRGGMSNLGICLQIESAIEEKADFILVNFTAHDRVEIPLTQKLQDTYSVHDIIYNDNRSLSTKSPHLNTNHKLISDTLFCLLEDNGNFINRYDMVKNLSDIRNALRYYFESLYSFSWKIKTDYWCLYASMHKLVESKIPFLLLRHENEIKNLPFLNSKNIFNPNFGKYFVQAEDPGYHTSPEDQVIISQNLLQHIKKYQILDI